MTYYILGMYGVHWLRFFSPCSVDYMESGQTFSLTWTPSGIHLNGRHRCHSGDSKISLLRLTETFFFIHSGVLAAHSK